MFAKPTIPTVPFPSTYFFHDLEEGLTTLLNKHVIINSKPVLPTKTVPKLCTGALPDITFSTTP